MFIKEYHATYLTLCTTKNYCFICAMIFADDLVLCESTREEAEDSLNYVEMRLRTMGYESAGKRRNTCHRLPVTTQLNLVEKKSRM